MTLRDNLAAVLDRIKEAIAAIDAAEAEAVDPTAESAQTQGEEAGSADIEPGTSATSSDDVAADPPADEPVHHGGPASV